MKKLILSFFISVFSQSMSVLGQSSLFKEAYRQYPDPSMKLQNYNLIQNLNDQLDKFSGCLRHLINYRGIDFFPPNNPVVLSRYIVLKILYQKQNSRQKFFRKEIKSFSIEKIPSNTTRFEYCNPVFDDNCNNEPESVDLSGKIKPWLCEAHFYLLPPTIDQDPSYYDVSAEEQELEFIIPFHFRNFWLESFESNPSNDSRHNMIVKNHASTPIIITRPRYEFLVVDTTYPSKFQSNLVWLWLKSLSIIRGGQLIDEHTRMHRNLFSIGGRVEQNGNLKISDLIFFCRFCKKCNNFVPIPLTATTFTMNSIDQRIRELERNIGRIFWEMYFGAKWHSPFLRANAGQEYQTFMQYNFQGNSHNSLSSKDDIEGLYTEIEAAIFKQVLENNSSFALRGGETRSECSGNPMTLLRAIPIILINSKGKHEGQSEFNFHPTHLKFVSCGNPKIRGFNFGPLTSIFQQSVWLSILSTMAFMYVLYTSYLFSRNTTRLDWKLLFKSVDGLMTCIRMFLEQGDDPITDRMTKQGVKFSAPRWIFCALMLTAIVLSNLYKNKNISEITLPRKPVPFDTFDMLVKHNFTTYTRGVFVSNGANLRHKTFFLQRTFLLPLVRPKPPFDYHDITNIFRSELFDYAQLEISALQPFLSKESTSVQAQFMMNHTLLLSNWFEILQASDNSTPYGMEVLTSCNKTALLLPDLQAHIVYSDLHRKKKSVFLSIENYFERRFALMFLRWVNPRVLKRTSGLFQSGIMNWWSKIFVDFMTGVQSKFDREFNWKPSTMHGNIFVVFAVFLVLVCASWVTFLAEVVLRFQSFLEIKKCKFTTCGTFHATRKRFPISSGNMNMARSRRSRTLVVKVSPEIET
ncbi:unnamed protein product [Orchesella dallaii]|uniref:Uncharacterized protein n=1 Tax=Orchesella dallaii TaxID=48710 RepID=A0ABP1S999_9HEXA